MSYPVGFTFITMNSDLFRSAIINYNGSFSELELLQIAAISSVINPVFNDGSLDVREIDNIRALLMQQHGKKSAIILITLSKMTDLNSKHATVRQYRGFNLQI